MLVFEEDLPVGAVVVVETTELEVVVGRGLIVVEEEAAELTELPELMELTTEESELVTEERELSELIELATEESELVMEERSLVVEVGRGLGVVDETSVVVTIEDIESEVVVTAMVVVGRSVEESGPSVTTSPPAG